MLQATLVATDDAALMSLLVFCRAPSKGASRRLRRATTLPAGLRNAEHRHGSQHRYSKSVSGMSSHIVALCGHLREMSKNLNGITPTPRLNHSDLLGSRLGSSRSQGRCARAWVLRGYARCAVSSSPSDGMPATCERTASPGSSPHVSAGAHS